MRALIDGTAPRRAAPSLRELRERRRELSAVCARHGASNLRVFGSVARQEEDAASDLDLLVDLERGRSLFDLAALVDELEQLLGCPVDVTIADSVKPRLAQRILAEAVPL
jgi:predicted nucleotidyltransferase